MEYLLGEISVDGPEHREEAIKFNEFVDKTLAWPEGWWAVSDDQFAYVAFFQFEADAWAYRLYLVNLRMNAKAGQTRYAEADLGVEAEEEKEWLKGRRLRTSPSASRGKSGRSRPRTGTTTSSGR
jgi:hypothetical protein